MVWLTVIFWVIRAAGRGVWEMGPDAPTQPAVGVVDPQILGKEGMYLGGCAAGPCVLLSIRAHAYRCYTAGPSR